ncbi:Endonuclease/Exonuclease/phosphatase family protein [Tsuneonella dongtanensis]|uniref:Endonuclease/Exonuclease/phosphatase family protein n=1 Tax=Tsuneonella dongtanensis TaxID=692370 RepID=A0A1B2A9J6_9SPHN|nr:endonuclease/exonuclease/phosphatase family protein [Tsuneonella dongtanensis]ANY18830.1 Endonuclease/Exonuclease/phosphatase family protein [Tsuneonella dongtanensis]
MQLTFASYNIHKGVGNDGRRDPDRIITVLREIDADVIALQECDLRFGTRASVIERSALDDTPWRPLPVARRARSLGWHGNALLVRRNFDPVEAHPVALPMLEPRGAVRGDFVAEDRLIRVLGMHLDLSGLRRRDQVRAILHHVDGCDEPCPTVLLGDFNQWGVDTGAMREFGAGWRSLAPGRSFPSRQPIAHLDRIVASRDWSLVEMGVHHSAMAAQASDHLPVWARLELHK